jgi:hypothetical protein
MELQLAHQLLVAADEQAYGFLRVRGAELAAEVAVLEQVGLVEAAVTTDGEPVAVIKRVTDLGHEFIRAFRGERSGVPPERSSVGRRAAAAA